MENVYVFAFYYAKDVELISKSGTFLEYWFNEKFTLKFDADPQHAVR